MPSLILIAILLLHCHCNCHCLNKIVCQCALYLTINLKLPVFIFDGKIFILCQNNISKIKINKKFSFTYYISLLF